MRIRTVLFDLDGTLLNTNEFIVASFLHTLSYFYPGQFQRADVIPFIGPPLKTTFGNLAKSQDEVDACIQMYREYNHAHHDKMVEPFPQVKEVLTDLKQAGIQLGIVTSKLRYTVEMGLRLIEIEPLLDVVVALGDVRHPKPHPEPILTALSRLHAKKDETLMVGDFPADIKSGKQAGVKTAGVSWTWHGVENLYAEKPDYILQEMKDLLEIIQSGSNSYAKD